MATTFAERVKAIRKNAKLTQPEFGAKIGISFTAVSSIEHGVTNSSEATRRAICREFNVRRQWLEDGIEPVYNEVVSADEYIDRVLADGTEMQKAFLRAAARLPDDEIAALIRFLESVNAEMDKEKSPDV